MSLSNYIEDQKVSLLSYSNRCLSTTSLSSDQSTTSTISTSWNSIHPSEPNDINNDKNLHQHEQQQSCQSYQLHHLHPKEKSAIDTLHELLHLIRLASPSPNAMEKKRNDFHCGICEKFYRQFNSLRKHAYEHSPLWGLFDEDEWSKHQIVQAINTASTLMAMKYDLHAEDIFTIE